MQVPNGNLYIPSLSFHNLFVLSSPRLHTINTNDVVIA